MKKNKIPEALKKSVIKPVVKPAFDPVNRERNMMRDAEEKGSYGIKDFKPTEWPQQ